MTHIYSSTVQGRPVSKIVVPIDGARAVSYSTSIDPITVYVTVFKIFDVKFS